MALTVVVGLVAAVAGVGLLYLLRAAHVARLGPSPAGALPLEQLANADAQPLARMALAWIPAGLAAGALLGLATRSARAAVVAVLALTVLVVLVVSAGVSDALTNNQPLTSRLSAPLGVAGTWVAVGFLVIGAAAGLGLAGAKARAPSAP